MTNWILKAQAGLKLPTGKKDLSNQTFNEVKDEMQKKKKGEKNHITSTLII